jgi:hypothetical protein
MHYGNGEELVKTGDKISNSLNNIIFSIMFLWREGRRTMRNDRFLLSFCQIIFIIIWLLHPGTTWAFYGLHSTKFTLMIGTAPAPPFLFQSNVCQINVKSRFEEKQTYWVKSVHMPDANNWKGFSDFLQSTWYTGILRRMKRFLRKRLSLMYLIYGE